MRISKNCTVAGAALAAAFALAGCGGSSSQVPPPATRQPVPQSGSVGTASTQQALMSPQSEPDFCDGRGGLKVTPCRIVFDSQHQGPANIIVHNHGLAITESDNCATQNVATVSKFHDFTYKVTAGSSNGRCKARFRISDGRHDYVEIVNNLH